MRDITVIAHDMRSTFNVGSLFRTAEGLGVTKIYLCGYTPYPLMTNDTRLPYISAKLDAQISKTALEAEKSVDWEYIESAREAIERVLAEGYQVIALEQSKSSVPLHEFNPPKKLALVVGTEVTGIPKELLEQISTHIEIPMQGKKESFNVVIALAMALYHCQYH